MARLLMLLLLALVALAGAWAVPALTGPTGLVVLPDALLAVSRVTLAGDVAANPGDRGITLRALYRLSAMEVGARYLFDDVDVVGLNAKVSRVTGVWDSTAALGAIYLDSDVVTERCLYLAVTRPGTLSVTGGLTWTEIRTVAGAADALRPYVGARLTLPNGTSMVGEYQLANAALEPNPISSLMILRESTRFTTAIGFTNAIELLGSDTHYYFAGISLALDR